MGVKGFIKKLTGNTPEQKEAKRKRALANAFLAQAQELIAQRAEEENQLAFRQEQEDKLDAMSDVQVSDPTLESGSFTGQNNANELAQLRKVLARSDKTGGRSDSEKYQAVDGLLLQIESLMGTSFGAESAGDDVKQIKSMMELYTKLINACGIYLDRKAHTKLGKERQAIVSTINNIANRDIRGLHEATIELGTAGREQRSQLNWPKIFKKARTDQYIIPNLTAATGGQASEIYMFDNPDKSAKAKKLFFKTETVLDYKDNFGVWVLERYKEMHPDEKIPQDIIDVFKRVTKMSGLGFENDFFSPEDFQSAKKLKDFKSAQRIASSLNTQMGDVFKSMDVTEGKHDISGRNVATSRVAELLGVGNLVAKSTFAEMDDGHGNKRKGIVMEGANGVEAKKWGAQFGIGAYGHQEGDAEFSDSKYSMDRFDKYQGENEMFQPSFFRDITSLQVLDCLCGQVDRHCGNFFIQPDDKGRFISVQGIDNDSAFGNNTQALGERKARKDMMVYDDEENLSIPYIDAALAERIKALSPEMLRMALGDIIGSKEIESAIVRLNKLKSAIGKAKKEQILQNESDWAGQVVKDKMMHGALDDLQTIKEEYMAKNFDSEEALSRAVKTGTYMTAFRIHDAGMISKYSTYKRERAAKAAKT